MMPGGNAAPCAARHPACSIAGITQFTIGMHAGSQAAEGTMMCCKAHAKSCWGAHHCPTSICPVATSTAHAPSTDWASPLPSPLPVAVQREECFSMLMTHIVMQPAA